MSTTPSIHHNVNPSEVGWQFVPQYYTFVNKQPDRLHCFYTKSSTFIHGTEGEDGKPCYGQQEIHNKITSINFQDCKVFIHSVDAQASANGGIIIQVIGEMSNNAQPWRKFAQTFFLAEQPNGYFVLNDIFRFLKEEVAESDDETDAAPVEAEAEVEAPAPVTQESALVEPTREPSPVARAHTPVSIADESAAAVAEPEVETIAQNDAVAEPVQVEKSPAAVERAVSPVPAVATPPVVAAPAPPPPAAVPAPAPVPALPKTWANLAATNSKKWGAAVAQESRGHTEVPASAPAPVQAAPPANRAPQHNQRNNDHPAVVAAQSITHAQCFVKGVTEPVTTDALQRVLTNRFGPIKDLEIVRSKACAFLEFLSIDAAKKAILASLNTNLGGEGGIRIDVGEAQPIRISVETKKERGERPPSRPRGGAPPNGESRGNFARGGRGQTSRGRGTPASK